MILTTYDRGVADGERKGESKGEQKALRTMLIRLASRSCGEPDEPTRATVQAIDDIGRLESLVEAAIGARSWQELLAAK